MRFCQFHSLRYSQTAKRVIAQGFDGAGKPEHAKAMYLYFNEVLRRYGLQVEEGIFAAEMKVELLNDGPITICLDSEDLK